MESKALSRQSWIDAALKRLSAEGPAAISVEAIAKNLRVTKGSFYWHFADRAELAAATLQCWRERTTFAIISELEDAGGPAVERFQRLSARMAQENGRLENAIRAWAASDNHVKAKLDEVDALRVGYLEKLFLDIGFDSLEAKARARYVYQAIVGRFAISPEPLSEVEQEQRARIFAALIAPAPKRPM